MPIRIPLLDNLRWMQAAFGGQDQPTLIAVPSGADASLVGKTLTAAGALTVAGNYDILIPLSGIGSRLEVHLTATIGASTATSALSTTYFIPPASLSTPSAWTNKTAATGTGALTSTVRQSLVISNLAGEQFAWLRITLGATPNVTFTQAEYNGL